jgi:protein-L-isoaspartate(D-aspartate) O-methyltransferase
MRRHTLWMMLAVALGGPVSAQERLDSGDLRLERERMVRQQIQRRDVEDPRVLEAMRTVRRHLFVPPSVRGRAYADHPLPIGEGQTISQPYIVALMSELMDLEGPEKVLEVGTGSGYQAAVLSRLCREVHTIEIKRPLYEQASSLLKRLGYDGVSCHYGDGYYGLEEEAPFDAIMITAAVDHIPPPLLRQLKDGGRLVLPLGSPYSFQGQILTVVTRQGGEFTLRQVLGVRFVPMTGRAEEGR